MRPADAAEGRASTSSSASSPARATGSTISGGHVVRNGKRQKDGFIAAVRRAATGCDFPRPITIPAGHWFMMGDNRGESDDSRFWGPVPRKWIIGGAFATYWPPNRIGLL